MYSPSVESFPGNFDFLKINQNTSNYPPDPLKFEGGFDGGHGSVQKSDMPKKGF
jgi:hypothetical protein